MKAPLVAFCLKVPDNALLGAQQGKAPINEETAEVKYWEELVRERDESGVDLPKAPT